MNSTTLRFGAALCLGPALGALAPNALAAPTILSISPASQTAYLGGAVGFWVDATGSPVLSYQWFFNGSSLAGATNTNLELSGLQSSDSGAYTVVVTNMFGAVTSPPAMLSVVAGPSYVVLHRFSGPDGFSPCGDLVLSGTTLCGMAAYGGVTNGGVTSGNGTVFKLEADGTGFKVLKYFEGGGDGCNPQGGLVLSGTTLYGIAQTGGNADTLFRMDADGSGYTPLNGFNGPTSSLTVPGLVLDGSTLYGITGPIGPSTYATVFELETNGSGFTVLENFDSSTGPNPDGPLVLAGGTLYGGLIGGLAGCGGVFGLKTNGSEFAVLKSFADGGPCLRVASRLVVSGTNLYGTASDYGGNGMAFAMNTDGSGFAVLCNLTGTGGDWAGLGGLALSGTTLYGVSLGGLPPRVSDFGDVFLMNTRGTGFNVLKSFSGGDDGGLPASELLVSGGTIYGATTAGGLSGGGRYGCGVIFALGFPPAITADPQTQTAELGSTVVLRAPTTGSEPLKFQWFLDGEPRTITADSNLELAAVQAADAGAYSVVVTNVFGAATSAPAALSLIPPVPRRIVPAVRISGQSGNLLTIEHAAALSPPRTWAALDRVALTGPRQWYFDVTTPLSEQGFYRAWQTNTPGPPASLSFALVPALTITGAVGSSVRIDGIDTFGPTNAWVALDTVTLTNTSQFYFDTSAIGQPARLWRIVPLP